MEKGKNNNNNKYNKKRLKYLSKRKEIRSKHTFLYRTEKSDLLKRQKVEEKYKTARERESRIRVGLFKKITLYFKRFIKWFKKLFKRVKLSEQA